MKKSWNIPRRTLLTGAGVAVALPFLEQMLLPSAHGQAPANPKRFVAMVFPNGIHMGKFTPATTGPGYALTSILTPLAPVKEDVLVVSGLENSILMSGGNAHLRGFAGFLTAATPGGTAQPLMLDNHISVDQVMAATLSGKTRLPSLELSAGLDNAVQAAAGDCDGTPCLYGSVMSWKSPTQPALAEENPQAAFDRLFSGSAVPGTSTPGGGADPAADARRALKLSVLDAVKSDTQSLSAKLGPTDKAKLDSYLTSLRELEMRVSATSSTPLPPSQNCGSPTRPTDAYANDYPKRLQALMDVAALALQCDVTRVITLIGAGWESPAEFPFLGVSGDHHGISHHGNSAQNLAYLEKIDTWEVEQFAYFVARLKGMQEGAGSILDSSFVYMGSDVSDGDLHNYVNLPVLVAGRFGGAVNPGRHLMLPPTPIGNMFLTALQGFDPTAPAFASSQGALNLT